MQQYNKSRIDLHRHVYGSLPSAKKYRQGNTFLSFSDQYKEHCSFSVFNKNPTKIEQISEIKQVIRKITSEAFSEKLIKCDFRLNLMYQNTYPYFLIDIIIEELHEAEKVYGIEFSLALSLPRNELIAIEIITSLPSSVNSKYISGIDFGGDEKPDINLQKIISSFQSKFSDKTLLIHAGEQILEYNEEILITSINRCLDYRCDRIGHGTILISDVFKKKHIGKNKELALKRLSDSDTILEFCPISLMYIYGFDLALIRIAYKELILRNVKLHLCTDNPGLFNHTLEDVYSLMEII